MNVVFPSGYRVEVSHLRQQLDQAHFAWQREWREQQKFVGENIRFEHNPDWRNRFFSIQSVRTGNNLIWKATRVVWMSMGGSI